MQACLGTSTRPPGGGDAVGRAGEVEQVGALGVVEPQGAGERVENAGGRAGDLPALEPGVVLDTEPGDCRDLVAAQPGDASAATGGEADLLGGDAGAAGHQELAHLLAVVHPSETRPRRSVVRAVRGALSVRASTGTPRDAGSRVDS
jgi:hypothetical protein